MPRVLLTGIPSHKLFHATEYHDYGVTYSDRRPERRTIADLREDFKVCGNTGNLLIGEGAAGALEAEDVTFLPFWQLISIIKSEERVQRLREQFDLVVMGTANIIRSDYDASTEADVLTSIGLPTLLMGAGIQVVDKLADVPSGTLRLIEYLSQDDNAVFTRGEDSAAYLVGKGVKNVTPTGCPSVYFRPDGMRTALARMGSIGMFSHRSMMIGGYIGHAQSSAEINFLAPRCDRVACVLQDEFVEYGMLLEREEDTSRVYDPMSGRIHSRYGHPSQSETDLRPQIHMFFDTDDWRAWASTFSLYFGRRFHGGVIAMQVGVPSLFLAIDDRMREMLKWLGFPYLEGREFLDHPDKEKLLVEFFGGIDVKKVIDHYDQREAAFKVALKSFLSGPTNA
ncbi:polysaccharide pyruvyl transferase family protein [Rhizobium sp.]